MALKQSLVEVRATLLSLAETFEKKGWHPGGAGSLTAKTSDGPLSLPHGVFKEGASEDDFRGEASPFVAALLDVTGAHVVIHLHHLEALLCADRDAKLGYTHLRNLAILDLLDLDSAEGIDVSILHLDDDTSSLNKAIEEALDNAKTVRPRPQALTVVGQGLYLWADDLATVRQNAELLTALLTYAYRRPMSPKRTASVSGFQL